MVEVFFDTSAFYIKDYDMFKRLLLTASISVIVAGCSSTKTTQIKPVLTTYGKEDVLKNGIKIPANTSTDNFRKLLMLVDFKTVPDPNKPGTLSTETCQTVSLRLQTEMAKLKRFTIFAAHGTTRLAEQLGDIGELNVKEYNADDNQALDLTLTGNITLSKQRTDKFQYDELVYKVECDFTCRDEKTHTVKFAEKAEGRATRKQYTSISNGKLISGYSQADETQAILDAAMQAVMSVANKLGNTYPVGGKIMGFSRSGTRFQFDKGFEQGIGKDSQIILYVNDGGVDIPLAAADAAPKSTSASAKVYEWNDDDEDAEPIIDDIKAGNWKNYKLYAAQYGMPVPPEWEKAYKD